MRYWDASVLVCLCVEEADTAPARRLVAGGVVTWSVSAIERRSRDGSLDASGRTAARLALTELMAAWIEISALAAVRERARRLVATHALRAAGAMQLAAALVAVSDRPQGHDFVCADGRLREAASREGFHVLPTR